MAEAFTDFKANLRSSYTSRANDYLAELYPDLTLRSQEEAGRRRDRGGAGARRPTTATPVTIEGMPIGLFENELTVQLWKPVTIRGYTFNVGDNVTLDQTKIQKTPAVGGDFAWLYATYSGGADGDAASRPSGTACRRRWSARGTRCRRPGSPSFLQDPYAIRPAAQLRMPRFHYGKADRRRTRGRPRSWPNYFAARDGAEFPYQTIPEQQAELPRRARQGASRTTCGAGWEMMTNKASPCLQCHAIGQFKPTGGEQVVNGPDLRQVATRFRPGLPGGLDRQPAAAGPLHGDAAEHRAAWADPDPGAQDVREPADRDGPGDSRHAAQLRQRGRAAAAPAPSPRPRTTPPAGGPASRGSVPQADRDLPVSGHRRRGRPRRICAGRVRGRQCDSRLGR